MMCIQSDEDNIQPKGIGKNVVESPKEKEAIKNPVRQLLHPRQHFLYLCLCSVYINPLHAEQSICM
jgi:hypothetical protein